LPGVAWIWIARRCGIGYVKSTGSPTLTRTDALLAEHKQFVRERAPQVNYSPGAIARNQRQRRSHAPQHGAAQRPPEVEVRNLHVYEQIAQDVAFEEHAQ
jgi:hypothetical protein